ncbi:MAG TPA: M3 family metallopeptidase [Gammaproteobacteria bacterium]|nr:M3 family metallopeptidase [Gammaproteobacteria bacterium]
MSYRRLIETWKGPFGGLPPFDEVKPGDLKPAIEQALQEKRGELAAVAADPDPPTFENTLAAMERSGESLRRVLPIFWVWASTMSGPEFHAIEAEVKTLLAAFDDEVVQNAQLFARIASVYESEQALSAEQKRLAWFHHTRFVLNGAKAGGAAKERVAAINRRLAVLYTRFAQNVLADEEQQCLVIDDPAHLTGLPASMIEAAEVEAGARGLAGRWVIANTRSSMEPFLTYSPIRQLRERAYRIWSSRGDLGNENDNNAVAKEILALRAERSKLLGYESFAHWRLADTMAKTPEAAMDLMLEVWRPAAAQVEKDVAEMQEIAAREDGGFEIEPWDSRYYAERLRLARYDFDMDALKPYLQLDKIREAMFAAAERLYGYRFERFADAPVYQADVTVYEVTRGGRTIGLWYFDPYARPGKQSGAWMSEYRDQSKLKATPVLPIVSNNANFMKGRPGEPILISWNDAVTMFHEFGHALHGLTSNVSYPSLSGTNTARDFVEFPSQFHERYLETPEVLRFLTDREGRPIPPEILERLEKAKRFNQVFGTAEFLVSGIADMKLHLLAGADVDLREFERETLAELEAPPQIAMRHRIPHFAHVFSSEAYAAGYYGYLWADTLVADAIEAFEESGNLYDETLAARLRNEVLAVGNTVDPSVAYRRFRGRDPRVEALLRKRGFM